MFDDVVIDDIDWLLEQFEKLPDEKITRMVSSWAEEKRSMPRSLTENPGPWRNDFAPYTVEIMDRLIPEDPAKDIVVMKGGQTALTTSVVENWIGYIIDEAPGPSMYVSGSDELSKNSIELKLDNLLESANLIDKIRPTEKRSRQLSGNTTARKDFMDGFLLAGGGKSTSRYRAIGIRNIVVDDLDEIPEIVGKQGSLISLVRSRQRAFDKTRKTLFISTPVFKNGPIHRLFLQGDQRYYYAPCKYCGFFQVLEFRGKREDGRHYGIYYELEEDGTLIFESVGYRCSNCLKDWKNYDKYDFLNASEWRPTHKPVDPFSYSYHVDGLYSPEYSWESMVKEWLECWDSKNKRIRDVDALKVFQNTARGLPYEERGEAPRYEIVVQHRRAIYSPGEVPNLAAIEETGSPILVLTAGADVHKRNIQVEVKGWCVEACSYSIEYLVLEGDTSNLQSKAWEDLRKLLENKIWEADDGKKYQLTLTLIDASYATDTVYQFCSEYSEGIFPIMGRDSPVKNASMRQFSSYDKQGLTAYNVNVTLFKDRIAGWLRKNWNTGETQPIGYPNFPQEYRDDFFKQYTVERKIEKFKKHGGPRIGFFWEKENQNADVHAWDCFVYNAAALEMLCYHVNLFILGQNRVDYTAFWRYIHEKKLYFFE